MIAGEKPAPKKMGSYNKDGMRAYVESYIDLVEQIRRDGTDVYTEAARTYMNEHSNDALKQFFVEGSYDPEGMTPDEIEDHIATMEQQYDNDRAALLEYASQASMNPMIGLSIPMHKNILMNMVFDKGSIPKFVATSPRFTISMEYRYIVDTDGKKVDMFLDQNMIYDVIEGANPEKEFELPTIPFTDENEIVNTYLGGLAGADNLSVETRISGFKVEGQYFEAGDILPDPETGYVEPDGPIAEEAQTKDVWVKCNYYFTAGYGELNRVLMAQVNYRYKALEGGDVVVKEMKDIISGTMLDNRLNIQTMRGAIKGLRVTSRLDQSNHMQATPSVAWGEITDYVEIPNANPINVTIAPEETKDIAALYNVNQVTKYMSLMKTSLAEYKDMSIKKKLDESFKTMDARSKRYTSYDWAPREGYHGDHVDWRYHTFMDFFDMSMDPLFQVLNDPNMSVTIYGDPTIIRRIAPSAEIFNYQAPANIGPVQLDYQHTVVTANGRVYNFIGSDKLRGNTELIVVLCPTSTDRIVYRIYDYQMYLGNEIRNSNNQNLPNLCAFERWKFKEYQPVQGRVKILHPTGLNDHYDYIQVKSI